MYIIYNIINVCATQFLSLCAGIIPGNEFHDIWPPGRAVLLKLAMTGAAAEILARVNAYDMEVVKIDRNAMIFQSDIGKSNSSLMPGSNETGFGDLTLIRLPSHDQSIREALHRSR